MSYILRYQSSRAEVWRWYWRTWGSRFWRLHLLMAALLAVPAAGLFFPPIDIRSYAACVLGAMPIVILLFAAWPQIMFKGQERTLQVGPDGWSTQIGDQSGSRPWVNVSSVQATEDSVVITSSTGNALVIPSRAFADSSQMQQFLQDAQAWHRGHAV